MAGIGDNLPPDMAVTAGEVATALSDFMAGMPVIENEDQAREAKVYIDRGKLCIADMEAERDGKVRPLNEQVKAINDTYRVPRNALQRILDALGERFATFLQAEEQKRIEAANEARRIAEEAERIAREAESAEQAAIESANSGVLDVDIKASVVAADDAFSRFQKADRQAQLAQKETKVRIGGGFKRAVGLRTEETLILVDAMLAIGCIGITEELIETILKAARAYRKQNGRLPDGIIAETKRTL